jgi:ketosteroid isomerase-like protein
MLDREWSEKFAHEWIEAWNTHDLERILAFYTDDFEMTSPLIVERLHVPNGRLKGKDQVRKYWSDGLSRSPNLKFELEKVLVGVNSLAIHYRSHSAKRTVIEYLEFDKEHRVIRGEALYGPLETTG